MKKLTKNPILRIKQRIGEKLEALDVYVCVGAVMWLVLHQCLSCMHIVITNMLLIISFLIDYKRVSPLCYFASRCTVQCQELYSKFTLKAKELSKTK